MSKRNSNKPKETPDIQGPVRQCMGCRGKFSKTSLIRVVRSPEGGVSIDHTGKSMGRGVYLCLNDKCYKRIRKNRAFERSLKSPIPEDLFLGIESRINAASTENP